jgi:hypothetical protein
VNKEAAAELCDIDFYFNFCTGTAVDVGHVACTVGEREREREREIIVVTTSRIGMLLGQFGIGHISIGLTVKLSSYRASYMDGVWGSGGRISCILYLSTRWRHNVEMK